MKEKLLVAALFSIGLLEVAGFLTRSPAIVKLGRMSGASPFPAVFSPVNGQDFWRNRALLSFQTPMGGSETVAVDKKFYERTNPSHVIGISRLTGLALGPWGSVPQLKRILHEGFCVSRDFSAGKAASAYQYRLISAEGAILYVDPGTCP